MKKPQILQNIPPLFFLFISLILTALMSSCETENNPKADAYINKQQIVYNAEIRTDLIVWDINIQNEKITIPNNGLDDLFLPFSQLNPNNAHQAQHLKFYIDQASVSNTEKENAALSLNHYNVRQTEIIILTQELIQLQLDSLKRYKSVLLDRLNGGTLTQVQYDQLLTNSKETFMTALRHKYVESRIFMESSRNLHEALNDLEISLSKKSWDKLVSLVKK